MGKISGIFTLVKPHFLYAKKSLVKNTRGEKVGTLSEAVEIHYVNRKETSAACTFHSQPVEKSVESVENFEISTGISRK